MFILAINDAQFVLLIPHEKLQCLDYKFGLSCDRFFVKLWLACLLTSSLPF